MATTSTPRCRFVVSTTPETNVNFPLFRLFPALVLSCLLAGCGHRGSLYLPSEAPDKQVLKQQVPQKETPSQKSDQDS